MKLEDWKEEFWREVEGLAPPPVRDPDAVVTHLLERSTLDETEATVLPLAIGDNQAASPPSTEQSLGRQESRKRQRPRLFRPAIFSVAAATVAALLIWQQTEPTQTPIEVLSEQVLAPPSTATPLPTPTPTAHDQVLTAIAAAPTRSNSARWSSQLDANNFPAVEVRWQGSDDRERLAMTQTGAPCVHLGTGHTTEPNGDKVASMTVGAAGAEQLILVAAAPDSFGCVVLNPTDVIAVLGSISQVSGAPPGADLPTDVDISNVERLDAEGTCARFRVTLAGPITTQGLAVLDESGGAHRGDAIESNVGHVTVGVPDARQIILVDDLDTQIAHPDNPNYFPDVSGHVVAARELPDAEYGC